MHRLRTFDDTCGSCPENTNGDGSMSHFCLRSRTSIRSVLNQPSYWLVFPITGILFLILGMKNGALSHHYPDESDEAMIHRVQEDVEQVERDKNVGQAWASLEQHVLKSEITEAE